MGSEKTIKSNTEEIPYECNPIGIIRDLNEISKKDKGRKFEMIDIKAFVKENYPKIEELGLSVKTKENAVINSMKKYPQEMLNDLDEDEIISFLFAAIEFSDAFAADFEGIEYADFLKIFQRISNNELLFEDVVNHVAEETLQKGEGSSEVSFKCNGSTYNYTARYYYDWFDTKFLGYLNSILEKNGIEKRLILFGDPNATLITYQKPDFCQRLKVLFPMLDATIA